MLRPKTTVTRPTSTLHRVERWLGYLLGFSNGIIFVWRPPTAFDDSFGDGARSTISIQQKEDVSAETRRDRRLTGMTAYHVLAIEQQRVASRVEGGIRGTEAADASPFWAGSLSLEPPSTVSSLQTLRPYHPSALLSRRQRVLLWCSQERGGGGSAIARLASLLPLRLKFLRAISPLGSADKRGF